MVPVGSTRGHAARARQRRGVVRTCMLYSAPGAGLWLMCARHLFNQDGMEHADTVSVFSVAHRHAPS
eukprot:4618840-Alexandrium_andersonii.AAC.1